MNLVKTKESANATDSEPTKEKILGMKKKKGDDGEKKSFISGYLVNKNDSQKRVNKDYFNTHINRSPQQPQKIEEPASIEPTGIMAVKKSPEPKTKKKKTIEFPPTTNQAGMLRKLANMPALKFQLTERNYGNGQTDRSSKHKSTSKDCRKSKLKNKELFRSEKF